MAIYHQHLKILTRAKGHNIVKAIAYRRGIKLIDPKTGNIYDYSRKPNVIHSEIVIPKNASQWLKDLVELEKTDLVKAAQLFANYIELREKRKDAQLARETEMALPMELTKEQNLALCHDFISFFIEQGMVAEFNIHWEIGNPHAHIILSMRDLVNNGWGKKIVEWNDKKLINKSREVLAEKINKHLCMAGFETKVSHLSNYDLGIDQEATVHVGNCNNSNQQARERNNGIHLVNLNKIIENPEIIFDKISAQQSTFDLKDVARALSTQLDPANIDISKSIIMEDVGYVAGFDGAVAPNLRVETPSIDQKITLQSKIQEVGLPKIELQPNSSPQQIVEQILTEITKNESVFTERYLTNVLSRLVKNPAEVAKILLEIKGSTQLMSIGFGEDGRERYTTRNMFDLENGLQDLAEELNAKAKHKVAGWLIKKCLKLFNLKDDQAKAIRAILGGKDIVCMIGRAGTGKSYSLKAARWAWERSGFNVYGVALAGIAAQNLEQDSEIKSRTIESFAYAILEGQLILSNKDIIVMDEAGMTDSISMFKVMFAVKRAGAKLVLVGDHAQLQPVGPGAIFRALVAIIGFAELTTIRRQKEEWQREATSYFTAGDTKKALGYYQEHGEIHLSTTAITTAELLINDWAQAVQRSSLTDNLILAYLNADVEQLNQLAREKMISRGRLLQSYSVQIEHKILSVAIGERIIFLENNWRYQVKNGQRGTVSAIELDEQNKVKLILVCLDGDQNKIVSFDPEKYKKFSYGYACTVHRSQGVTVKNSFILAVGRWCKNLTYVAMTRHQESASIYASEETYKTIEELKKGLAKGNLKDSILDYPEAFAERRGVDPQAPNNIILLQQHIAKKLKSIKQKFADTYERIVSPQAYLDNIAYKNKITQTLQRREDARLVAAYIDAHCQVGKAWAEFKASNDHLEYQQNLNQTQILRNSIAAKIYAEVSKYTTALEIYDLKLETLEKQAKQHELRSRVLLYIDKSKVSIILRDNLANEIAADLKAYYPYLKGEHVNTKQLLEQAKEHRRRIFLLKLSLKQRKAFKQVEHYLKLARKSGELWGKCREVIINNDVNTTLILPIEKQQQSSKLALQRSMEINQERDHLAYIIKNNQILYQAALDYFEVGEVSFDSSLMLPAEQQYQAATGLSLVDLPKDEQCLYNAVALYLGQDVDSLRSIVAAELEDKVEQYQQFIALPQEKTIRDYIADLKTTKQWAGDLDRTTLSKVLNRPIITIGINGKIINPEVLNELYKGEPIFVRNDNANNYNGIMLAAGVTGSKVLANLQQEIERNKRGSDRLKRLEKHAKYYELRSRVLRYIDKSKESIILRDQLANEIEANLKAHYPYLKNENVNIKQLIEQAKDHRRRIFLLKLSLEQRKAFKQVEHYLKLSKKSAELWSQKKEGSISSWVLHRGLKFNQERDFLAYTIKQNLTLYQEVLDYFEIGTVENTISEARLKRLESQALEFERKKHLQENLVKFKKNIGNFKLRRLLAKEIVVTPKYYHMARDAQIDPSSLYKYAKYQEKIELLDSLNPNDRAAYLTATSYKYLRREVGKLWSEIFTRKNQGLPIDQKVFSKAIQLKAKRDQLAYLIEHKTEHYHKFLLSEQIPTKDLKKHAKSYENYLNLQSREVAKDQFSAKRSYATIFNHEDPLERIYLQPKGFSGEQLEKQKYAQKIVDYSIPITGTLAEKYLKEHRGIIGEVSEQVFRFHPGVKEPETKKEWPTLVVIARNEKQEVQSVQCIFLDPITINKLKVAVPKRTYGPQEGAKVLVQHAKFIPGDYYKYALTYGPETALSIAAADRNLGVYLTLGANFDNVPITTSCVDLLLCVDQEGLNSAANKNLNHAIESLAERGLNVYCARPNDVKDFNVVMKTHGALEVKRLLDEKKLVKEAVKMEQLIKNKGKLVSDYAIVMVDFVTKYKEYNSRPEPKSVEEVRSNHELFKQLGKIASFIKGNGIFAEICERHKLEDQVYKIEKTYVKAQQIELVVEKLLQELNTKNPIKGYIKIIEEKNKLEGQLTENRLEQKALDSLNEQAGKFAYIIKNTPTLQYEAKDLAIYNKIETQAFAYQRKKEMANEIDLDMGFGWGD